MFGGPGLTRSNFGQEDQQKLKVIIQCVPQTCHLTLVSFLRRRCGTYGYVWSDSQYKCVAGKLVTGAKIFCPPSSESFQLVVEELVPTAVEVESEDEDEGMEEPDVTELELDSETEPLKASS